MTVYRGAASAARGHKCMAIIAARHTDFTSEQPLRTGKAATSAGVLTEWDGTGMQSKSASEAVKDRSGPTSTQRDPARAVTDAAAAESVTLLKLRRTGC